MVADDASRKVTFSGKVVARQGDLIISCDRMLVSYQPRSPQGSQGPGGGAPGGEPGTPGLAPGQGIAQGQAQGPPPGQAQAGDRPQGPGGRDGSPLEGGQEIDQVTCEGAVKIQQGDRLAVGDQALYLAKAVPRRLVLTGQARVWQGENSVTGHRITYFLDENRSHVDSQGGGRVRAFYDQGGAPRP
jgi:lipopolysaccharide export system protein LptA